MPEQKPKREGLIPRTLRRTYRIEGSNPSASGPITVLPANATPEETRHETRHAEQFRVPGYPLMKIAEMFYPYGAGPMERDAYRVEQPSHEFLRGEKLPGMLNAPRRWYRDAAESYIQALLGD
jgi:hypothetical protein